MSGEIEKLNAAERTEILAAFRDHDFPAWERYHAARLLRRHAASAVMEAEFEALLARAAAALAEALDEEIIREATRQTYFSALLFAGYPHSQAQAMAAAFASQWHPNIGGSYGL